MAKDFTATVYVLNESDPWCMVQSITDVRPGFVVYDGIFEHLSEEVEALREEKTLPFDTEINIDFEQDSDETDVWYEPLDIRWYEPTEPQQVMTAKANSVEIPF